jgi:hypothetical protein
MRSKKKPRPDRPGAPATEAAERIAVIIDVAEKAAAKVIDDAEEQARRHLDEARVRADQIVAERLRELADDFESAAPVGESVSPLGPRLRSVESPAVEPEDVEWEEANGSSPDNSAAARLLATQMAVSGSSREEIESRLRSGFEIEDAEEMLDAILGPEE